MTCNGGAVGADHARKVASNFLSGHNVMERNSRASISAALARSMAATAVNVAGSRTKHAEEEEPVVRMQIFSNASHEMHQ